MKPAISFAKVIRWLVLSLVAAPAFAEAPAAPAPAAAAKPTPFAVTVDRTKDEFCLVVVPDTQRYAAYFPEIFHSQFQWIRNSVDALDIKYVIHLGDIVEEGTDEEWRIADEAFSLIDGVVPYLVVPGNHDLDRAALHAGFRATTRFNAVFPPLRFAGRPWYGGHKGVTNDNNFGYFRAAGRQFAVLGLEYGPSDETLDWARTLVSNFDDLKVILVTHCYMYDDDTRVGPGDKYNPNDHGPDWNDGEGIWRKLVNQGDAIGMVLSGHIKGDGTGLLVSKTDAGSSVVQMLSNYQFLPHGGEGWLRILKFLPREKKLEVYTFSPWLGRFRDEPDQRFSVDIPGMFP